MSTHNIHFRGEIRKISELFGQKSALSEAMLPAQSDQGKPPKH